jgi:hypothetical protein
MTSKSLADAGIPCTSMTAAVLRDMISIKRLNCRKCEATAER